MVQVRAHQPVNTDGSINLEAWLDHTQSVDPALDRDGPASGLRVRPRGRAAGDAAQNIWAEGMSSFQTGLEIAEILAELKLDQDRLLAAVIYPRRARGQDQPQGVEEKFGAAVAKLIEGVLRMAAEISTSTTRATRWWSAPRRRWRTFADAGGHGRRRARGADQAGRAHLRHPLGQACRRREAPAWPARCSTSTRRWPTASASAISSGSWRTSPSATSSRSSTSRSPSCCTSAALIASSTSTM